MASDRPVETWGQPPGTTMDPGACWPAPMSPQAFGQPELRGGAHAFQDDRGAAAVDHTDHRPTTTTNDGLRDRGSRTSSGNICH